MLWEILTTGEAAGMPGLAQGFLLLIEVDPVLASWTPGRPTGGHVHLLALI